MDTRRILLVDDEVGFTNLVKMNLEKTGHYEVRVENSGMNAARAASEFNPHLVLLDIVMPGKDGGEVLAELEHEPSMAEVPVVFLTATISLKGVEAQKGLIRGMPFMAKPVDTKTLIKCIEQYINA
jgi:CheY-like chemotaxis protein